MRHPWLLAFGITSLGSLAAADPKESDASWLSLQIDSACAPSAAELGERIVAAVAGVPNEELAVSLILRDEAEQTTALVRVLSGMRLAGEKKLSTSSCEETLDAVVAVVALALSTDPSATDPSGALAPEPNERESSSLLEAAGRRPQLQHWQGPEPSTLDAGPMLGSKGEGSSWRAFASVGVDRGTFAEAVGLVGVGGVWVSGRSQLRGSGFYGLVSSREEVTGEGYLRERADYAALNFDYCHGIDRGRWVSACGGVELGWGRLSRVERDPSGTGFDVEHSGPSFAPSLATLMALRSGPIQPELTLYALFPSFGRVPRGERLALRGTLGAAVPF